MAHWIGVASKEHVALGVAGGFCQLCQGKAAPLKRMSVGDWIVYYSPKEVFGSAEVCQQFTAIGEVIGEVVYPFEMFPGFIPHRRAIRFLNVRATPIRPLLPELSFINDKIKWGAAFRFGHLKIPQEDFELIAKHMLGATSS